MVHRRLRLAALSPIQQCLFLSRHTKINLYAYLILSQVRRYVDTVGYLLTYDLHRAMYALHVGSPRRRYFAIDRPIWILLGIRQSRLLHSLLGLAWFKSVCARDPCASGKGTRRCSRCGVPFDAPIHGERRRRWRSQALCVIIVVSPNHSFVSSVLASGTPIPLKDPDTLLSLYRYHAYVFVITIMAAQNNLRRFLHARITIFILPSYMVVL